MNWKEEAKAKLRKYNAMRLATINIPLDIERLKIDAQSIRSSRTDAVPVEGGGSKHEEAMLNNIMERQELERSLKHANLWVQSVDSALCALSKEDKLILHRLFISPEPRSMERLCSELNVEQSTAYRRRDSALYKFTIAMYGAIDS